MRLLHGKEMDLISEKVRACGLLRRRGLDTKIESQSPLSRLVSGFEMKHVMRDGYGLLVAQRRPVFDVVQHALSLCVVRPRPAYRGND